MKKIEINTQINRKAFLFFNMRIFLNWSEWDSRLARNNSSANMFDEAAFRCVTDWPPCQYYIVEYLHIIMGCDLCCTQESRHQ